jgi:LEA14-like dessication related protein
MSCRVMGWQRKAVYAACLILGLGLLSACSALRGLLGRGSIQRPQVEFVGARLTGLSFDRANFVFDLKILNPNPLGVKLAGFGYDLLINEHSFIKGREDKEIEIEAQGENVIQIPLTISYQHLYQALQSLRQQDTAVYRLNCDFSFDLPVLGPVQIPASKRGNLPLPKLPAVEVEKLKLKDLGLSGADLVLEIRLKNPNAFSVLLNGMQYQFTVEEKPWAWGETGQRIPVSEKAENLVEIPISLDFFHIGQSVYQVLAGNEHLSYQFQCDLDLETSLPLLGRTNLPFDLSGLIEVLK